MSAEKISDLQKSLISASVQEFLADNFLLENQAKSAWVKLSTHPSDKNISLFLKSLRFIHHGIPSDLNLKTANFAISLILKEIVGDLSSINTINVIKKSLDKKSDSALPKDLLLTSISAMISNEIAQQQAKELENQIIDHVRLMTRGIQHDIEKGISRESDIQKIREKINQENSQFINFIKMQLKKGQSEDVKVKIDNKYDRILEQLEIVSTRPFINKIINNISKNANRLENEGAAEKARSNRKLVDELVEKSNCFYAKPALTLDKANKFFVDFSNNIEKNEKALDIPRNIWKPILGNLGLAITGIGLLVIIGKASYAAYDYFVNKNSGASPFFFTHAKSYEIAEKARKTAITLREELPRSTSAAGA